MTNAPQRSSSRSLTPSARFPRQTAPRSASRLDAVVPSCDEVNVASLAEGIDSDPVPDWHCETSRVVLQVVGHLVFGWEVVVVRGKRQPCRLCPVWERPMAHLLQTRSVSLVCLTLAAVSLRWRKSIDRGAEPIYLSGHVMADSLYV